MINEKSSRQLSRMPVLLALACALPMPSGAEKPLLQAPPPNASQQMLIEIHGLTGVGWWSPPTHEIEEAAPAKDAVERERADA